MPLYMAHGNKGSSSIFQLPEEDRNVQRPNVVINKATKMRKIVRKMLIIYIIPHLRQSFTLDIWADIHIIGRKRIIWTLAKNMYFKYF